MGPTVSFVSTTRVVLVGRSVHGGSQGKNKTNSQETSQEMNEWMEGQAENTKARFAPTIINLITPFFLGTFFYKAQYFTPIRIIYPFTDFLGLLNGSQKNIEQSEWKGVKKQKNRLKTNANLRPTSYK